jgi:hypothetical protein
MVTGVLFLVPVCVPEVSLLVGDLGVSLKADRLPSSLALPKLVVLLETMTAPCSSTTAALHSACA